MKSFVVGCKIHLSGQLKKNASTQSKLFHYLPVGLRIFIVKDKGIGKTFNLSNTPEPSFAFVVCSSLALMFY